MKASRGWTLIEILLVVTIIAILCAVALPSMVRSKISANEVSAIQSMRVISEKESEFKLELQTYGTLEDLSATSPPYLDEVLGRGTKSGYFFSATFEGGMTFTAQAIPQSVGETGNRFFFVSDSNVIHFKTGAAAGSADPPLD